jgi:UDP-N-acetylmuramoyl-L-alanyl-D-glutamate--2,6-diaminopimelate ligase
VTIGELLEALRHPELLPETPVINARVSGSIATGVVYDSRRVSAGCVFVALRGQTTDGAEFAPQAAVRGATVIVAESPRPVAVQTPWVVVPDARLALAYLADRFYEHPSADLRVVGITGTNGKTTTAFLIRAICEAAGLPCGLMGTVMYSTGSEDREATRTTPEAPDVQAMLREMVDRSCAAAVMEVSSHALALKRVDGIRFAAGVFTNLTRDHLDFHGDMETYAAAKARLFELLPSDAPGVVNADDPKAAAIARAAGRKVTYAVRSAADVTAESLSLTLNGLEFDLRTPRGQLRLRSPLIGRPNVYNVLAAAATGFALDLPDEAIQGGVSALTGVPGRFEIVSTAEDDTVVVVDYAHTDDALRNVLETARSLAPGRLVTVFGCGGDRDRTKRPLMGAVAGRLSDVVIVTSDNPRSEDPRRIVDEVLRGMPAPADRVVQAPNGPRTTHGPEVHTLVDRKVAINKAIEVARAGDVVIVAGKGHEKYQVIGDRVLKFDDVEVAREALARRRTRLHVV